MAIGNALVEMYNEMQAELDDKDDDTISSTKALSNAFNKVTVSIEKLSEALSSIPTELCPECGEPVMFEGGCKICKSCGWTKCE